MQKPSHTPGPFITDGGGYVQALYTPNDGGKPFYHTIARTDQPLVPPAQQAANSHLFAAAPNFLILAKRLVQWDKDFPVNSQNCWAGLKELDAIIADSMIAIYKAEGK